MRVITLDSNMLPERVYWRLKDLAYPVWLDSSQNSEKLGRYTLISAAPSDYFTVDNKGVVQSKKTYSSWRWDKALDDWLDYYKHNVKTHYPFIGGAIGYISYDMKNLIERLPQSAKADITIPYIDFKHYDWTYLYDHIQKSAYLLSYDMDYSFDWIVDLLHVLDEPDVRKDAFSNASLDVNMSKDDYCDGINRIKSYIKAGDVYQINYTQRFSTPYNGDDISLYYHLRRQNPAPFSAFIRGDNYSILSSSPERFLQKKESEIHTRPIKGTIARGEDAVIDAKHIQILKNSEKDKAELLMIVDLERNDLSKIAQRNSVRVPENFVIESYQTVHHLVSTVMATIRSDVTFSDILKASFPGGSITGAPKIRAMEIIDELEPHTRNIYTGSIGYISVHGDFDFNIVIRTILSYNAHLYYQVGGGIVWDSETDLEYRESLTKGIALKRVIYNDLSIRV